MSFKFLVGQAVRSLLLQRLPQFVEQPRVLDGDDGLGGEVAIAKLFDDAVRGSRDEIRPTVIYVGTGACEFGTGCDAVSNTSTDLA